MKKFLLIMALGLCLSAAGCGIIGSPGTSDKSESASGDGTDNDYLSGYDILDESDFAGNIETDANGNSTYTCPYYTISDFGEWKMNCDLRTFNHEFYIAFSNRSTYQGNVAFMAYDGEKKRPKEELLSETLDYGEDSQYSEDDFKGFPAYYVTFAKNGHTEERIIFETDSALFVIAAFFYREPQYYQNDKGSAESLADKIIITGGN